MHCMTGRLVHPDTRARPVDRPRVLAYQPLDRTAIGQPNRAAWRSPLTEIKLPDKKSPVLDNGVDDFDRIDVAVGIITPRHQVDDELRFRDADDLRMRADHRAEHRRPTAHAANDENGLKSGSPRRGGCCRWRDIGRHRSFLWFIEMLVHAYTSSAPLFSAAS